MLWWTMLSGVILDVEVTTGEINEGQVILRGLDAVASMTGTTKGNGDGGYAYAKVFAGRSNARSFLESACWWLPHSSADDWFFNSPGSTS